MTSQPPLTQGLRVRAIQSNEGRRTLFQDPDQGNKFLSRADAVRRLRYDSNEQSIVDSFGTKVSPGSLQLSRSGQSFEYVKAVVVDKPTTQDPRDIQLTGNQQIVERNVIVKQDGSLVASSISSGLGEKFDEVKTGGKWAKDVSDAAGLKPGERLPTVDLKRKVLLKEYIILTILR